MVRCERFVILYAGNNECSKDTVNYYLHPIIFDRVEQKTIVDINTGDGDIDMELAESILTMVNIKFIGE